MSAAQTMAIWMFYMLSLLKRRLGLTWDEFDGIRREYGLSTFLLEHYELLHYYDNDYVVDDTLRYIREQGGDVLELQRVG
ncbi:MAG: DUF3791 domain-containing protein [Coriobacteriales bacterium]|nr:DUF3791 domain-containing protein [Coriobacteriales bacterium]